MANITGCEASRASNLMPRLGAAFFKARGAIPTVLRIELEARSLAPRHVQAMNIVALAGRITVGQLASRLSIGRPAASQIATELKAANWLVRQHDDADRRRIWLSIASDRRREIEAYCRRRVEPLLSTLSQMSPKNRRVFLAGLEQLASEIESHGKEK